MDADLLDATRQAVAGFLRERDLPPKLSRLRDEAIRLLGSVPKGG